MTSKYLKEFEELNTTTDSIYDLGDYDVLIILEDGTNLTSWENVTKKSVKYVSEDLSNCDSLSNKYRGFSNLEAIVLKNVPEEIKVSDRMFYECSSLADISGLKDFDISNIDEIVSMFYGCSTLTDLSPLANWDFSTPTKISSMFEGCSSLTDLSPLANWDTSNIRITRELFRGGMFEGCSSLTDLSPLANWDISRFTNMDSFFRGCSSLTDLSGLENWDTSNLSFMWLTFKDCSSLEDISALSEWDTSNVSSMCSTFRNCSSLRDISPLSEWDTSQLTSIKKMFAGCSSLTDLSPLANWDTSQFEDVNRSFARCSSLEDLSPLANWDVSQVKTFVRMFRRCSSLVDVSCLSDWNLRHPNFCNVSEIFMDCPNIEKYPSWYEEYMDKMIEREKYSQRGIMKAYHTRIGRLEPKARNEFYLIKKYAIKEKIIKAFESGDVLSPKEIAEKENIPVSTVRTNINKFLKAELIYITNPERKRNRTYKLTEEGKEVIDLV